MKVFVWPTLFFLSLLVKTTVAYIETIDVWRHPVTNHVVYGAADWHQPSCDKAMNARDCLCFNKLYEVIDRFSRGNNVPSHLVIVEDLAGYRGTSEVVKQCPLLKPSCPALLGLESYVLKKGLPVVNVEYRFQRVFLLETLLIKSITGKALVDEYQGAAQEIKQFNDPLLQNYYQEVIASIETADNSALLADIEKEGESLVDYFGRMNSDEERLDRLKKLFLFDMRFIDARALHAIASHPLAKNTLLFLGARHIANSKLVLEHDLGYTCIKHIGLQYTYPLEPINQAFADDTTVHEPISVDELDCLGKNLDEL